MTWKLWWKVLTFVAFFVPATNGVNNDNQNPRSSLQFTKHFGPKSFGYDIVMTKVWRSRPGVYHRRDAVRSHLLRRIRSGLNNRLLKLPSPIEGPQDRPYIVKPRRRGDPYSYLVRKAQVSSYWKEMLNKLNDTHYSVRRSAIRSAYIWPEVRRWEHRNRILLWEDYDRNYNWENGGEEYSQPGKEPRKLTKWEKFAENWQMHALKFLFVFSAVSMVLCCCIAFCKKFCGAVCAIIIKNVKDARDICLNRDPSYRHARKFADDYGIELDYDQFMEIKKSYESALSSHYGVKVDLSGRQY